MAENETGRTLAGVSAGEFDLADGAIYSPLNASSTQRQRLPDKRRSEIAVFTHESRTYRATVSRFADGRIGEIFLDVGRYGADLQVNATDSAILCSLALQSGVPAKVICTAIRGPIAAALRLFEGNGA